MSLIDVEKEIKSLDTNKASHSSDIPSKILKRNVDFFSPFILGYVNKLIRPSTFPSIRKLAGISPVYKKDHGVKNYFSSRFSELLEQGNSVTIHYRNLQTLAYEIFKLKNTMAYETLTEMLPH